ncbi:MAG: preprotein translocase subunit YajC [Actinomycetota bacterium]|nr:preprotein translocase subunit YajC [Actinomycetota bacterium]
MEGLSALIFPALLIAIFYFMLIRPQRKRADQHKKLIESVGYGDEVVTIGGVFGIVRSLDDAEVELEVAPGTTMRFLRTAIARRVVDDPVGPADAGSEGEA